MSLDPEFLSRLQFAWVVGWHILLPAFTIGLASFIALLEGAYALTGRAVFLNLSQFWLRIFAISFGMGVVTGIVMPFQFGTNWSRLSDAAGNIISPLLAYEGLTAFFLEATFLGVLLFGRKLVPPAMHFVAAVLVAVGTLLSAFWILATNSWMQTPVGYEVVDGLFYPKDWFAIVFSPSLPYRFAHTVSAFYVTTAFVVLGVGAYTVRRGQSPAEGRMMLRLALWFLVIFVPIQVVLGDLHGLNTLEHQPAKLAAIEGLWDGGSGVPASIIGWPDQKEERNIAEIAIPKLGSLYLTHSWNGAVKGLKDFPADRRPPVAVVYFAFRIMVGIALLMLAMVACGLFLLWRRRLDDTAWYLKACQFTVCLGFIAVIAGWTTTEVGRQPWTDLRPDAHGEFVLAVADRRQCAAVARALRRRLSDHLPDRHLHHAAFRLARPRRFGGRRAGRQRPAEIADRGARARNRGDTLMPALDLVPIWTAILAIGVFFYVALDGFDLGVGMLYNFAPDRECARSGDELDRADLGRQRDLAHSRQRRPAGRFPGRLRHHHSGGLFPDPFDAAGADLPRACLRIPLPRRRAPHVLGSRLCRGLCAGGFRPRRGARLVHPGLPGRRPPLRRRLVRLLHAVFDFLRASP